MTTTGLVLGLYCIVFAVLIFGISIPLYLGKVKMNRWYGVRIEKAFVSNDNWYKINRYGAKRLMVWSMLLATIGVVTLFFPFDGRNSTGSLLRVVCLMTPLIMLIPVVETLSYARKL